MYLNRLPSTLYKMIGSRLNYSLKKKNEQQFVYTRLGLFDQRYYLELHQQLWQCYLDIGLQQHVWPVSCFRSIYSYIVLSNLTNQGSTT
jgi:hypothetical protein